MAFDFGQWPLRKNKKKNIFYPFSTITKVSTGTVLSVNWVIACWGKNSLNIAPSKEILKHAFILILTILIQHIKAISGLLPFHVCKYLLQQWEIWLSLFSKLTADCFNQFIFSLYQSPNLNVMDLPCPRNHPPSQSCMFWCWCAHCAPLRASWWLPPPCFTLRLLGRWRVHPPSPPRHPECTREGENRQRLGRERNRKGSEQEGKGGKRKERV